MGSQANDESILYAPWFRGGVTGLVIALCLFSVAGVIVEWSGPLRAQDFWATFRTTMVADAFWAAITPVLIYWFIFRWNSRLNVLRNLLHFCVFLLFGLLITMRRDNPFGFDISSQWQTVLQVGLVGVLIVEGRLAWLIVVEKRRAAADV